MYKKSFLNWLVFLTSAAVTVLIFFVYERINPCSLNQCISPVKTAPKIGVCTQEERQKHIDRVCQKYQSFLKSEKPNEYILNPDRKVAYCIIPKNGCTTWSRLLAISTNKGRNMTRHFSPHKAENLQLRGLESHVRIKGVNKYKNSTKFVILRHPLTRFLSAFNEKMHRNYRQPLHSSDHHWMEQRQRIAKYFRKKNVRFPYTVFLKEFVAFVTDKRNRLNLKDDLHWRRQHAICDLCSERYRNHSRT